MELGYRKPSDRRRRGLVPHQFLDGARMAVDDEAKIPKIIERRKNIERHGTDNRKISIARKVGQFDRVNGNPFDDSWTSDQYERNAYEDGFVMNGNQDLMANLKTMTEEQIAAIAENDYLERSRIPFDSLPEKVKENPLYISYYKNAMQNRIDEKPRKFK